jgi:hypothetical protein
VYIGHGNEKTVYRKSKKRPTKHWSADCRIGDPLILTFGKLHVPPVGVGYAIGKKLADSVGCTSFVHSAFDMEVDLTFMKPSSLSGAF